MSLDALLTERSVTRAAARLHVSQPALSAQLARIRTLFADPMLVRSGRRMVPTPRALAVQAPLRALLDELQTLVAERSAFEPATARSTFRVAATDLLHELLSPALVASIPRRRPGYASRSVPSIRRGRGPTWRRARSICSSRPSA